MPGCSNDSPLLPVINTRGRATECGMVAQSNFDKDYGLSLPHYQVDFSLGRPVIPVQGHQTLSFQKFPGPLFGNSPALV